MNDFRAEKGSQFASRLCVAIQGARCETWSPSQHHVINFSSMKRSPTISADQSFDFASIHKIRRIATVSSHFLLDFTICFFPKRTDEMLPSPRPFATICHRSRFRNHGRLKIRPLQGRYFYLDLCDLCRTSPYRRKSDTRKVLNLAGLSIFLGNLSIETK
jgi:hypothetical protein